MNSPARLNGRMRLENDMSYKDNVVNAAINSMEEGGYPGARSLSLIFERLYDCGYNEAGRMYRDEIEYLKDRLTQAMNTIETLMKTPKVTPPEYPGYTPPVYRGCSRCGISSDAGVMGYVCSRLDCPTKVTC